MLTDITDKKDIQLLIDSFYQKVREDDVIGYIFNEVAKVDWEHHLPIMYGFWEMVLFGSGNYKGDPMTKHIQLDKRTQLDPHHFERWRKLFHETIDTHFQGSKADEAKQRSAHIASLMQFRIEQTNR